MDEDRRVRSDEARRTLRNLLDAVERDGARITVCRYETPVAVLVPVAWYREALAALEAESAR
jgi:prevent-host-death family protein